MTLPTLAKGATAIPRQVFCFQYTGKCEPRNAANYSRWPEKMPLGHGNDVIISDISQARTRLNTGGVLRKARLLTQGAELRHGKKCNFY